MSTITKAATTAATAPDTAEYMKTWVSAKPTNVLVVEADKFFLENGQTLFPNKTTPVYPALNMDGVNDDTTAFKAITLGNPFLYKGKVYLKYTAMFIISKTIMLNVKNNPTIVSDILSKSKAIVGLYNCTIDSIYK